MTFFIVHKSDIEVLEWAASMRVWMATDSKYSIGPSSSISGRRYPRYDKAGNGMHFGTMSLPDLEVGGFALAKKHEAF